MQPFKVSMDLSPQSNPAEFAALFMATAQVDELVVRDTVVVANVAAGTMTQADRFGEAIKFFRHVLAIAYLLGSALELGCKTIGDAAARLADVHARATRLIGFDPFTALDHEAMAISASKAPIPSSGDPLLTRQDLRNLVSSVLASTDLPTLLEEAYSKGRQVEMFDLLRKLTRFLRRLDVFFEQRVRVLADKYVLGELSAEQIAEILGIDEDEALVRLRQPRNVEPEKKRLYRSHPDDESDVSAALDEVAQGKTVDLTTEELAAWEATGDLPASVEARFAGCHG